MNHSTGNNIHKVISQEIASRPDEGEGNSGHRNRHPGIVEGGFIPLRPDPVGNLGNDANIDLWSLTQ